MTPSTRTLTRTGTLVGYVRVSTDDQHTDLQTNALRDAGCERIYEERASGTRTDRAELVAALDYLRPGDTLVTWRLDRLGRSMSHLITTVTELDQRGIGFRSVTENIDTTTATGRLVFHMFSALAEFERGLLAERTRAGLDAARERGAKPGRKPSLSADQVAVVRAMHATGEHTVSAIASVVGVSRATVYRQLDSSA